MTIARSIDAVGVSDGWVLACRALLGCKGQEASHLVVRMTDPLPEDPGVRRAVDELLAAASHQPVVEVRNTIFPAALAEEFTDPDELIAEYLEDYGTLQLLGSPQGTYFGRICEYPHPDDSVTPQLANTIAKLSEARTGTRWRAIYELNIYAEHRDNNKKRGFFPCMAHLSFQLAWGSDGVDRLDCLAVYRYQDLMLKGYGNYLGLAELQRYIAQATGFVPGELTVIAGHAHLSLNKQARARLLALLNERPA
ncbi:MAG: thymidylate synthase [Solirubrobacteraceae bacterium]